MLFCNEVVLFILNFLDIASLMQCRKVNSVLYFLVTRECIKFLSLFGNKLCRFYINKGHKDGFDIILTTLQKKNIYINFNKLWYMSISVGRKELADTFEPYLYQIKMKDSLKDMSFDVFHDFVFPHFGFDMMNALLDLGKTDIMMLYKDCEIIDKLSVKLQLYLYIYFLDIENVYRLSKEFTPRYLHLCFYEYKDTDAIKEILSLYSNTNFIVYYHTPLEIVKIYLETRDPKENFSDHLLENIKPEVFELFISRLKGEEFLWGCTQFMKKYPGRDWGFLRKKYAEAQGNHLKYRDLIHSINIKLSSGDTRDLERDIKQFRTWDVSYIHFPLKLLEKQFLWALEILMEKNPFAFIKEIVRHKKRKALMIAFKIIKKERIKGTIILTYMDAKMFYFVRKFIEENPDLVTVKRQPSFNPEDYTKIFGEVLKKMEGSFFFNFPKD